MNQDCLEAALYRATIPLFNTWIIDAGWLLGDSPQLPDYYDLGQGIRIVQLNDSERTRMREYWRFNAFTSVNWRLEVHAASVDEVIARAPQVLDQLTLVVRNPVQWRSMPVDRLTSGTWTRYGLGHSQREIPNTVTHIPLERLEIFRRIIEGMPSQVDARVNLALSFYAESVREFWAPNFEKSMTLASIALECLLGDAGREGLSDRYASRGAHLVASGFQAVGVAARLKKLYVARSKVIHEGKSATFVDVTHLQQFLMRAIPSMMQLCDLTGGHKQALRALDDNSFIRDPAVNRLFNEGAWWGYVDVFACFQTNPAPRGRHLAPGTYWWLESMNC